MPFPNATPDDWNTKIISDITNMANKPVTWQNKEWTQVDVVPNLGSIWTMVYRQGKDQMRASHATTDLLSKKVKKAQVYIV